MNYIERVIEKMNSEGYIRSKFKIPAHIPAGEYIMNTGKQTQVFLDPEAWRSLGKAMGWDQHEDETVSLYYACSFMKHLFAGGTIESYCKELIEN